MSVKKSVSLHPTLTQSLPAKSSKVLTKAKLIALLEQVSNDLEIRVNIKLSDIYNAKRCMQAGNTCLEFELMNDLTIDETGINLSAWVHPDRFDRGDSTKGTVLVKRETGIVRLFNDMKGFGFITREDGQDVFVHYDAIQSEGFRCLRPGSKVEYTLYQTSKGLQAQDVIILFESAEEED